MMWGQWHAHSWPVQKASEAVVTMLAVVLQTRVHPCSPLLCAAEWNDQAFCRWIEERRESPVGQSESAGPAPTPLYISSQQVL